MILVYSIPCEYIRRSSIKPLESNFHNFSLFGSKDLLSLWPSLSVSPILTSFAWSPLVQSAAMRNFLLHTPDSTTSLYIDNNALSTSRGLVAIHLRRGDYIRHCPRLAKWNSTFMGYNQFPSLPDRFPLLPSTAPLEEREEYYTEHCWPSVEQIVEKLAEVRRVFPGLKRVFALTNGWVWWVNQLRDALVKDGWEDMKSSLDVVLDREQSYVAVAVDMAIAERAEAIVGNGVSILLLSRRSMHGNSFFILSSQV